MRRSFALAAALVALLLLVPYEARLRAAVALLNQTAQASANTTSVTTTAISTTGATLIVVCLTSYEIQTEPTVSDSQTNTWTALTQSVRTGQFRTKLHYVLNPSTSGSHTFTASSGVATYPVLGVMAFSGTLTSGAFDKEAGGNNAVTSRAGSRAG